jgi:hypothetical protein
MFRWASLRSFFQLKWYFIVKKTNLSFHYLTVWSKHRFRSFKLTNGLLAYIEILRVTVKEACLKKGITFFSSDLQPILWSEERFCRPLWKIVFPLKYIYYLLGWSADFLQGVLSPKYLRDQCQQFYVNKISMISVLVRMNGWENIGYSQTNHPHSVHRDKYEWNFIRLQKIIPGLPDLSWYRIPKREKYTKCPRNIFNGRKILQMAVKYRYQYFSFQGPPNIHAHVGIFGMKLNHLATLLYLSSQTVVIDYVMTGKWHFPVF